MVENRASLYTSGARHCNVCQKNIIIEKIFIDF